MYINNDWAENVSVIKANLLHEKVHDKDNKTYYKDKKVLHDVSVYNDDLNIHGNLDCIEFLKNKNGVYIENFDDKFTINIIEYKPTSPKNGEVVFADKMQLFLQKLCVDYIWTCDSDTYMYYFDTRKRKKISFESNYAEYLELIKSSLETMNYFLDNSILPLKEEHQKCSGCSFKDICFYKTKKVNIRESIISQMEV